MESIDEASITTLIELREIIITSRKEELRRNSHPHSHPDPETESCTTRKKEEDLEEGNRHDLARGKRISGVMIGITVILGFIGLGFGVDAAAPVAEVQRYAEENLIVWNAQLKM